MDEKGLDWKFTFGQYKDLTLEEVIDDDVSYVSWVIDNIDWFEMNNEAYEFYEQKGGE